MFTFHKLELMAKLNNPRGSNYKYFGNTNVDNSYFEYCSLPIIPKLFKDKFFTKGKIRSYFCAVIFSSIINICFGFIFCL